MNDPLGETGWTAMHCLMQMGEEKIMGRLAMVVLASLHKCIFHFAKGGKKWFHFRGLGRLGPTKRCHSGT